MSSDCTDNWCMDDTPHPAHPSELRVWADRAERYMASQKAHIAELETEVSRLHARLQPFLDMQRGTGDYAPDKAAGSHE